MEEAGQMKRADDEQEEEEEKKMMSRKEKRKAMKKMKRAQIRREMAVKERVEEEVRFNDPEEQRRIQLMEQLEAERIERERKLFEERERIFHEQQQQHQKLLQQQQQQSQPQTEPEPQAKENEDNDGEWEYVEEEGPPEIIWQGNEIIFKKKKHRVRVSHKDAHNTPTSNPLPPESPPQPALHNVNVDASLQLPYFGTEQDKAHCPFHLKTGACRFGQRCSRVHFYPDNSCTLLIKNMYSGPGLAWEQDEGLEQQDLKKVDAYTDEEVERCFEEFYDDVHTEFLKFGEIVNFKVCKNGSFHLRGNVYVQYKMLDSALLAYKSVNGRYFAGKQVSCEFVNLTRWKVAICGEYMKSGFQTCSHGTACNFIHCFRNPGGDYEWADSDKPPPKYWVRKMAVLFGYSDDYETFREAGNLSPVKNSSKISKADSDRYHSGRSRSLETNRSNSCHSGRRKHEAERNGLNEERNANLKDNYRMKRRFPDSDRELLEKEHDMVTHHIRTRKHSFYRNKVDSSRSLEEDFDVDRATITRDHDKEHRKEARKSRKGNGDNRDRIYEAGSDGDRDRKRHHNIIKRKSSRHESKNNKIVIVEAEFDKDLFDREDIEIHDHSKKSMRQGRSGLRNDYKDHENEDEGRLSWRKSDRRAHDHKK